jgi:hypothetical protein
MTTGAGQFCGQHEKIKQLVQQMQVKAQEQAA